MVRRSCLGRYWIVLPLLWVGTLGASAGDLRLVDAIRRADHAAVRALLTQKIDVNVEEADGTTPLHWAVRRDDVVTTDLLIHAGAKVQIANRYGVTPLSLACTTGNPVMIARLLKAGALPNAASAEGETPLMIASRTGRVEAVKLLLAHGANVNSVERWKGQTALMWAAGEGNASVAQVLLENGGMRDARSKGGFTPLLFATRAGQVEALRVLLAAGANPNETVLVPGAPPRKDPPTSALVMAILNQHYELASVLLEKGANPNIPDSRGSALHVLAWMRKPGGTVGGKGLGVLPEGTGKLDSLDLAKSLLAHGANPKVRLAWEEIDYDRDDQENRQPAGIAGGGGREYLTDVGATPFYLASRHGDIAFLRLMAAAGADPLIPTVQNVTPFMAAAGLGWWEGETPGPLTGTPESDRLETLTLLLELTHADVNAVADFGNVPLVGDPIKMLWDNPDNLEILPENALGDLRWNGSTAMHGAVLTGQPGVIRFLVDHGAKLDVKNKLGWTPLMVAEGALSAAFGRPHPEAEALVRQLMIERHMDPDLFSQRRMPTSPLFGTKPNAVTTAAGAR